MAQGKIRKRWNNAFEGSVSLGRHPETGKRWRVFLSGASKEEVKHKKAELLAQIAAGTWTPPARESFGAYLWRWLDESANTSRLQPSTVHGYRNVVRQASEDPLLGSIPLRKLTPAHLERYYTRKGKPVAEGGSGLSSNAARAHRRVIRAALSRARKHKLIGENTAALCDLPAAVEFEPQILESDHLRLFLAEAKRTSRFYPLYLVAATTGMRLSELLGARWSDLGKDGIYQVRQAFVRVPHVAMEKSFKGPKTKKSRRPSSWIRSFWRSWGKSTQSKNGRKPSSGTPTRIVG